MEKEIQTAREFINKFKDTKTLPHIVTRLSKLIADPESTMKDFENVIKMDPILVVRLLKLVNSPYYGLSQQVDSIGRAVAFIGMKNLHNLAVTDALKNIFNETEKNAFFPRQKLWLHSAAVSICSKMVAERIFGINGDDAYLCGILHDLGIIIEEQIDQDSFFQVWQECDSEGRLPLLEKKYLGTRHPQIGYLLTEDWQMPEELLEAIRNHHNYDDDIEPSSLTGILQIAEYITCQLGYTIFETSVPEIASSLAAHMEEHIDEYKILVDDLPEEMDKAKALYGE